MNTKFEKILEFDIIKKKLEEHASCELSKKNIRELVPSSDFGEVQTALNETDSAVNLILRKGQPPLGGVKDVRHSLLRASAGGMLSFAEILAVGGLLKACRRTLDYVSETEETEAQNDLVIKMINELSDDYAFENRIFRSILSEEEMSDDASPTLRSIRRQIVDRQTAIKAKHINTVDITKDISRYNDYVDRCSEFTKFYIKSGFNELDKVIGGLDRQEVEVLLLGTLPCKRKQAPAVS